MEMTMSTYQRGDHVKVEIADERLGECEWIWIEVDHCDDGLRLVFGRLDSQPVTTTGLKLGQELAVSYDNIRGHRRFRES
jgi:uncharacterized protein YegJ (DUF2314 family)